MYKEIYHYTSMECFQNMLKSLQECNDGNFVFWASSIFYMNDQQEFYNGYDLLMKRFLPQVEQDLSIPVEYRISEIWKGCAYPDREEYDNHFISNLMDNGEVPFIVSFSHKKDDAVLWNKYGDKGCGVCLVFCDYSMRLIPASEPKNIGIEICDNINSSDVSYDGDLDEICMTVLKRKYMEYYSKARTDADNLQSLMLKYLSAFAVILTPRIKTKDFSFEDEARLIRLISDAKDISYRCGKSGSLIPYMKIDVPIKNFKGVYLGACSQMQLNMRALTTQFKSIGVLADKFVKASCLSQEIFK